jgi:hypothetical protein
MASISELVSKFKTIIVKFDFTLAFYLLVPTLYFFFLMELTAYYQASAQECLVLQEKESLLLLLKPSCTFLNLELSQDSDILVIVDQMVDRIGKMKTLTEAAKM